MTLEEYIRTAAQQRGINPDIAIKVAQSEGGLSNPTRQSDVMRNGAREPSYGPFQMLVGGGGSGFPEGLGNDALSRGIDPRNPDHAYKAIDFALDTAKRDGWGRWYGAKAAGLDKFAGIGGHEQSQYAAMPDGPKGQESYSAPVMGSMMAGGQPQPNAGPVPYGVQQAAAGAPGKSMADIFGMMAMAPQDKPQFSPVQIAGPSPGQANALAELVQALKSRML